MTRGPYRGETLGEGGKTAFRWGTFDSVWRRGSEGGCGSCSTPGAHLLANRPRRRRRCSRRRPTNAPGPGRSSRSTAHFRPMLRMVISLAVLALLVVAQPVPASTLFDEHGVIEAELIGPVSAVMRDTHTSEERSFSLLSGGETFDVQARLRGRSRLRVCPFRPLRLRFPDGEARDPFAGVDKVKLAVPCRPSMRSEKDLLEEYAAYRILNLVTDASFRVRLLRVRFAENPGDSAADSTLLHSFLIEPDESMAARLGGAVREEPAVALSWLDRRQAAIVYVFEYLIGNTDWSLVAPVDEAACCHNAMLVDAGKGLLYVPYDFDLSGLVDAPYAKPAPELRIDNVRRRLYRGFCTERGDLRDAVARFRAQRDGIETIIRELPVLTDRDKHRRIGYLEQFFREAENENRLLDQFERHCLD